MDHLRSIYINLNLTGTEFRSLNFYNLTINRTSLLSGAENYYRNWSGWQWSDIFHWSNYPFWESFFSWSSFFHRDSCCWSDILQCFKSFSYKWNWRLFATWWTTFGGTLYGILSLGFGSLGVTAGSFAAMFQSFMYGGLTPAGGVFAMLTRMGMLGTLVQNAALWAGGVATAFTGFATWFGGWYTKAEESGLTTR
ncbi:hypothetical protein BDW74DRAFT_158083 [Aspergillus multicolor]|uniref:interferon alpha-inducible IFI6/IFI27 family protein n=1 Tax=Aspergillus multicolor TaxID=41759 RepID=UPI003CCDEB9E